MRYAPSSDQPFLRRITQADPAAFARVVDIYLDVFPASERKSPDVFWGALRSEEFFMFELADKERALGMAIAHRLNGVGAVLLEYMGVRRDRWSHGLGQRLFRDIAGYPDFSGLVTLLEVEKAGGDDPRGERARRQQFYRELGCREVEGLDYVMPQIEAAKPPPMDLLVFADPPRHSVEKTTVQNWVAAIYRDVYRRSTDDVQFSRMSERVPQVARIF